MRKVSWLMKKIKNLTVFILLVFVFFATVQGAYCKTIKKEIQVQTKDSKIIKATLTYIKIDGVKKYPTVVLLHSLGASSADWGPLVGDLNNAGYAVLAIDFRGHGKSIYDATLHKKTWVYINAKGFQRFPSDVLLVLDETKKQAKKADLNNMAIVGADIGANTAVLVSKELKVKPKTLVLISPTVSFKGLYIPLAMVDMGPVPILSMVSKKDKYCLGQQQQLAKFAQGGFYAQNYSQGGMGMMLIKSNPVMALDITKWVIKYLK